MNKFKIASVIFLLSTFVLKFSSMIRDLVIAGMFGDSYHADAYIAAMTIPNALILFLLTGMKDAFLPSYYKYDALGKGEAHLTNIIKGTALISLAVGAVGMLLASPLIRIIYPNSDFIQYSDGMQVAVWTVVIYFASLFFVGINAVYEGYFDAHRKFSFSVFSQTSVVLSTIVFALVFHSKWGILAVPIGYFVGTIISFLIKVVYRTPKKFINWKQKMDLPEIKEFYGIFWPVGLTIAVGQINLLVNTFFAARLGGEGVVANLNYAFRLINIPQAIFAVTIATIVFPIIAKAKADNNMLDFRKGIEKGLLYLLVFLTPALAGMWVLMNELVTLVYERGAFTASATAMTSSFAVLYIGSTFFYSIQAIIAKGFYTLEKGHYMMRIGIISIFLNVISNWIFSIFYGAEGIALSASIVAFLYSAITFTTLWKLIGGLDKIYLVKNTIQVMIATVIMTIGLSIADTYTDIAELPPLLHILTIALPGVFVYFIVLMLFRNEFVKTILSKGGNSSSIQ
ncbi:murein biosynthesis integral membrane protein MurJ [Sporosarcina ureilytica]|uniref:Murein biosynthesis protein MurJ n=1 Tax=Sporosarcina ureilytica TaxID=298596 RepID=A0A1D8JJA7_9BACL|nr:lipid II flippase MurJ [Sporosarcina ureilytica]AOV08796.1 murein biosynthesis protein MurJ [Sporosarcina ureilytica]